MNLSPILTLPARLAKLPARIALHVWDTARSQPSHHQPADDLPDIEGGDTYWLYWVYPEQRISTRPHTSTPCACRSQS